MKQVSSSFSFMTPVNGDRPIIHVILLE
ncbi:hypothetical protein DFA_01473 [Cavenderia fasciculata]|uniref:Uncharacterized protein n=1 Tax=Cavenderia fasciculata TaxID=261658 RepID=F4PT11_CACFS|nr:hypothetical protein DFA_01473 [Cavenderia fasciculata]EGG21587.1 hypothetical protein DFA_01473 [Cavenderia fasciculata]|eukprot:XP_004359437.1 hypothetical protein DFA_01473 [Cavenderia fasciculata]